MAHDVFLKIDGIEGEADDANHPGWIRILSFSHLVEQPVVGSAVSGPGNTAARASHGDFLILKRIDQASPRLALHCCSGKPIPKVTLELCQSDNTRLKFMEYTLSDVLVRSVRPYLETLLNDQQELFSREYIAFRYGRIDWIYSINDGKGGRQGNIQCYWDAFNNRGG